MNRLAAIIVAGLLASIALQIARERWYPETSTPVDEVYFTSGSAATTVALSFKSVLADVYWIRAIQYFAATRLKNKPTGPRDLLFPLLDITTSLDPAFNLAYRFGAIFLAERHRGGTFQPELAIKLLDKGFAQNPTRWEYLYDKAFVYYWTFHDPKAAAHWFSEAAKAVPDSADWLPGLAAIMLVEGGDRRSSAIHVPADAADRRARVPCETTRRFRLAAARHPGCNRSAQRHPRPLHSRSPARARRPGSPWSRATGCAPRPPTRMASPLRSMASGRAVLDPASKFNPLPIEPASKPPAFGRRRRERAEASSVNDLTFAALIGLLGPVCGLVPQRVHLPPAAGPDGALGTLALPQLRSSNSRLGERPRRQLACPPRALRRVQRPHLDAVSGDRVDSGGSSSRVAPGCMARRCCWWPG